MTKWLRIVGAYVVLALVIVPLGVGLLALILFCGVLSGDLLDELEMWMKETS